MAHGPAPLAPQHPAPHAAARGAASAARSSLAPPRPRTPARRAVALTAAAAARAGGADAWLAELGVDVTKQAAVLTADGTLVCSRPVAKGEALFSVPEGAWLSAAAAAASPLGPFLAGVEPWLALALLLLHERSRGAASRWAAYIASLPQDTGSPVAWGEADLEHLRGTQLLSSVESYR